MMHQVPRYRERPKNCKEGGYEAIGRKQIANFHVKISRWETGSDDGVRSVLITYNKTGIEQRTQKKKIEHHRHDVSEKLKVRKDPVRQKTETQEREHGNPKARVLR